MRALALVLPWLPIEAARRVSPALARSRAPLVLVERGSPGKKKAAGTGALFVAAASREALEAGARVGWTCAQARAVVPELMVAERRPEEERATLLGLARAASFALAPRAGTVPERRAVLVDATGAALAHGSEKALVQGALALARALGLDARAALADAPLAALAVAGAGSERATVVPPGGTRAALEPLPPAALGLEGDALRALAALGIATVAELLRLPRASIPSRFGEDALARVERALGERQDPIAAERQDEPLCERLLFDGATDHLESIALALEEVAARAAARLSAEGRAARALELSFARERGRPARFALRLAAPIGSARGLRDVLRRRLERLDLSQGVSGIDLVVTEAVRAPERQGDLFQEREGSGEEDVACLVAKLEARLGARRVLAVAPVADHRPERAFSEEPFSGTKRARGPSWRPPGRRPARLFRPRPVEASEREDGTPGSLAGRLVVRALGPERVETGFWDGGEARRDYWVVRDEDGRELWAFRELETGAWWVHGVFE